MNPPFTPREALALLGVSSAVAFLISLPGPGPEGSLWKTLRPTLHVLAWVAPAWLLLERRKRDPVEALAIGGRPRRLLGTLPVLFFLPVYALAFWRVVRHGEPIGLPGARTVGWALVSSLAFAALPEEVFFRGALQPSLRGEHPVRAIAATSALFALAHVAIDPEREGPARLLVFFPSLVFGWLRERTGSVLPGIAFHALCNATNVAIRTAP